MSEELISKKTLYELQEHLSSSYVLREIEQLFDSADVPLSEDYHPNMSGQRRTLVARYYHSVDLTKWEDVRKLLHACELVLDKLQEGCGETAFNREFNQKTLATLTKWLQKDGFIYRDGKLVSSRHIPSIPHLESIAVTADVPYILTQLKRIEDALDTDVWLAIGTAKELVETTCKTILKDLGKDIDPDWTVLELCKETRKELKLTPDDIHDTNKAADTIKRLLSNLAQIVQGIAELRNPYGTGHGPHGRAKGLQPRHARLVAGAASTLAMFLLETHRDRKEAGT